MTERISRFEVDAVEEFDDINRNQGWDIEYRQLHRGRFRARMQALDAPGALVSYEEVTGPLDVRCDVPAGSVALLMPVCPKGQARLNGFLADGCRAFLLSPSTEVRFVASADTGCHVVRLSSKRFAGIAATLGPARPLRRAETRPVALTGDAFSRFQMAIDEVLSMEQQGLGGVESQLACLLESVAKLSLRQDGDREKGHSDAKALGRALEFIDANIYSNFSSVDLCEAALLQRRSLERLFRKELGISPMQYVLARRMNRVRRQLLVSDANDISVADVAQDCGFAHLSRFAGRYREFFSEMPNETLRSPVSNSAKCRALRPQTGSFGTA